MGNICTSYEISCVYYWHRCAFLGIKFDFAPCKTIDILQLCPVTVKTEDTVELRKTFLGSSLQMSNVTYRGHFAHISLAKEETIEVEDQVGGVGMFHFVFSTDGQRRTTGQGSICKENFKMKWRSDPACACTS